MPSISNTSLPQNSTGTNTRWHHGDNPSDAIPTYTTDMTSPFDMNKAEDMQMWDFFTGQSTSIASACGSLAADAWIYEAKYDIWDGQCVSDMWAISEATPGETKTRGRQEETTLSDCDLVLSNAILFEDPSPETPFGEEPCASVADPVTVDKQEGVWAAEDLAGMQNDIAPLEEAFGGIVTSAKNADAARVSSPCTGMDNSVRDSTRVFTNGRRSVKKVDDLDEEPEHQKPVLRKTRIEKKPYDRRPQSSLSAGSSLATSPTPSSSSTASNLWISADDFARLHSKTIHCPLIKGSGRGGRLNLSGAECESRGVCNMECDTPRAFSLHLKEVHDILLAKTSQEPSQCAVGTCQARFTAGNYLRHIESHTIHFLCPFIGCDESRAKKSINEKTNTTIRPLCRIDKLRPHMTKCHPKSGQDVDLQATLTNPYAYAAFDHQVKLGQL